MNVSSMFENTTLPEILPVSFTSHMRNRILGGLGLVCNVAAVVMLGLSSSIRPSLKVSLISLSLSDLLFMLVAAVWRPSLPCWPAMYVVSSTVLVSYFSIGVLALHNYLAVFYPTRCQEILSTHRTLVTVVACWLAGLLVSLACLGVHIPSGSSCYVIVIMPRLGVVVESCICLLSCCFIIMTNLRVLLHIRRRPKPGVGTVPRDVQAPYQTDHPNSAEMNNRNKHLICCESSAAPTSSLSLSGSRPSEQNLTEASAIEMSLSSSSNQASTTSVEPASNVSLAGKSNKISPSQNIPEKQTFIPELETSPIDLNCTVRNPKVSALDRNHRVRVQYHHTCPNLEVPVSAVDLLSQWNKSSADVKKYTDESKQICKVLPGRKSTNRKSPPRESQGKFYSKMGTDKKNQKTVRVNTQFFKKENDCDQQVPVGTCIARDKIVLVKEVRNKPSTSKKFCCSLSQKVEVSTKNKTLEESAFKYDEAPSLDAKASHEVVHRDCARNSQSVACKICPTTTRDKETPVLLDMALPLQNVTKDSITVFNSRGFGKCAESSRSVAISEREEDQKQNPISIRLHLKSHNLPTTTAPTATREILNVDIEKDMGDRELSKTLVSSKKISQVSDPFVITQNSLPKNLSPSNLPTASRQTSDLSRENGGDHHSIVSSFLAGLNRSRVAVSRSTLEKSNNRICWQRRTQCTLLILCTCCCLFSLPYIVYGGYVAIWIEDRASFISSGVGILVSSLAVLSSITNPLLYAWRLVKWKDIWKKVKRVFKC